MTTVKNRLNWSVQEDNIIRQLYQNMETISWKKISKELYKKMKYKKRSAKQCRQRYMNCLKFVNQQEKMADWNKQQEQVLYQSFLIEGPKWVKIALNFPGKSENNIKNKFYGTLRKFLRKLNKIQKEKSIKAKKQIKYECFLKLVYLTNLESKPSNNQKLNQKYSKYLKLRQQILKSLILLEETEQLKFLQFAEKLHEFSSQTRFLNRNKGKIKEKQKIQAKMNQNSKNEGTCLFPQTPNDVNQSTSDKSTQKQRNVIIEQIYGEGAKQTEELNDLIQIQLSQQQQINQQEYFNLDQDPFQFIF